MTTRPFDLFTPVVVPALAPLFDSFLDGTFATRELYPAEVAALQRLVAGVDVGRTPRRLAPGITVSCLVQTNEAPVLHGGDYADGNGAGEKTPKARFCFKFMYQPPRGSALVIKTISAWGVSRRRALQPRNVRKAWAFRDGALNPAPQVFEREVADAGEQA